MPKTTIPTYSIDDCFRRLGSAILLQSFRDIFEANGSAAQAEIWLLSDSGKFYIEQSDFGNLDIDAAIERVRNFDDDAHFTRAIRASQT